MLHTLTFNPSLDLMKTSDIPQLKTLEEFNIGTWLSGSNHHIQFWDLLLFPRWNALLYGSKSACYNLQFRASLRHAADVYYPESSFAITTWIWSTCHFVLQNYTSSGVQCWTGNDDEAYKARHQAGATGAISVASNLFPGNDPSKISNKLFIFPFD